MISNRRTVDDDRWISNVFISLKIFSKALYLYCINLLWTLSCVRCAHPIIISVDRGHQLNVRGYHKPKTILHVLTVLSANQPTTQIIWIEQILFSTKDTAKKKVEQHNHECICCPCYCYQYAVLSVQWQVKFTCFSNGFGRKKQTDLIEKTIFNVYAHIWFTHESQWSSSEITSNGVEINEAKQSRQKENSGEIYYAKIIIKKW